MCCLQSKRWIEFSLSLLCVSDTQSYLTLLWPSGLRPAASSVHVIPLVRMLEWVAISFSRGSSPKLKLSSETRVSCLLHWQADSLPLSPLGSPIEENGGGLITEFCSTLATPLKVASQAPLSIEFSRQEYWSGLPFPPPRDLPDLGIEPESPALAGSFFTEWSIRAIEESTYTLKMIN